MSDAGWNIGGDMPKDARAAGGSDMPETDAVENAWTPDDVFGAPLGAFRTAIHHARSLERRLAKANDEGENLHAKLREAEADAARAREVATLRELELGSRLAKAEAELADMKMQRDDLMSACTKENTRAEEAERDSDLAIVHDRQPYQTAWAYEQVCRVYKEQRERAEAELANCMQINEQITETCNGEREMRIEAEQALAKANQDGENLHAKLRETEAALAKARDAYGNSAKTNTVEGLNIFQWRDLLAKARDEALSYGPSGNPWGVFLKVRADTIDFLLGGLGETYKSVAEMLSMDPTQVELIAMRNRALKRGTK